MKAYLFLSLFFLILTETLFAQTTLQRGDLAIIQWSALTGERNFSFVTWVDLSPGTKINFTTNPFLSTQSANAPNNCNGSTSIIEWTNTTGAVLKAGTIISIAASVTTLTSVNHGAVIAITGSGGVGQYLNLVTNGRAIFAYQGTHYTGSTSPSTFTGNILFGICYQGTAGDSGSNTWLRSGPASSFRSYLPAELNNAFYNINNFGVQSNYGQYTGPRSTAKTFSHYQMMVTDLSNWTTGRGAKNPSMKVDMTSFTLTP